jgi:hypothetical protein
VSNTHAGSRNAVEPSTLSGVWENEDAADARRSPSERPSRCWSSVRFRRNALTKPIRAIGRSSSRNLLAPLRTPNACRMRALATRFPYSSGAVLVTAKRAKQMRPWGHTWVVDPQLLAELVVKLNLSIRDCKCDYEQDIHSEQDADANREIHPHPRTVTSRADGSRRLR